MARWYSISCAACGNEVRVCEDWSHPPRLCQTCEAARAADWYEKECERCGGSMRVNRTWEHVPAFCPNCRTAHPPILRACGHCGQSFTISTATQLRCGQNGWDPPKRCATCRELFRHKPFRTIRDSDRRGNTIFCTYNSRGDLISESQDEVGWFGDERRRHRSGTGTTTGFTRKKAGFLFGGPCRETTGPDGRVKSRARDRTSVWTGQPYTESTGGTSATRHITKTVVSWLWGRHRRTT